MGADAGTAAAAGGLSLASVRDHPQSVAALDLGSNSFHMIVAKRVDGQLQVVDRLKEMVRLAGGLDAQDNLSEEAVMRALDCLARFGQRVRDIPGGGVRAVGTNTLRRARAAADFLGRAEQALGQHIDIIAGREEARLIYLGVAHSLAEADSGPRLVMDIGGGSTELIIGRGFEPHYMESLEMGCVSMSRRFFPEGQVDPVPWEHAGIHAHLELQPVAGAFRERGWGLAIGSSGTIQAVADVLSAAGWAQDDITLPALKNLRRALIKAGRAQQLGLPGLSEERAPVFPGGVAILLATFEALQIERMVVSDGALREGLLYDLLGRIRHEDIRERTVEHLMRQYQVDTAQAARVEATAGAWLGELAVDWGLEDSAYADLLSWAARLHEIGLAVSHSQYHQHGAYLIANSDLPGFSRQEQRLLGALVAGHRRKLPSAAFDDLPVYLAAKARRLCMLLRLAVLLHRSRSAGETPAAHVAAGSGGLRLQFQPGWLDRHPLTLADLAQEVEYLRSERETLEYA